ncbi:MAG: NAD(P)/FAD-dependent oxidoreductase [Fibrobacterota bacterium]
MNAEKKADIIVIGAGPGGAMAAKHAAAGGREVLVLERKERVGVPVRCGEGIGYKGLTLSLPVRDQWVLSRIQHIRMYSPAGISIDLKDIDESFIIDRTVMDAELASDAVQSGARLMTKMPVHSIRKESASLYRCETPRGDFVAPVIIIADGVESRLARDLGWNTALSLSDIDSCAFCRVRHASLEDGYIRFYTGKKVAPGGYLWIFPRGKGYANVGLGVLGTYSTPGKARELLRLFLDEHLPGAELTDLHCGGVPVAPWLKPLVRDGIMIVGDAARQVSCLTGGGIAYALHAGTLAGKAAASAWEDGTPNVSRLIEYERQWAKTFGRQQRRTHKLKNLLLRFKDAELDKIAESMKNVESDKMGYLRVFTRVFARHPLSLLRVITLFR